MADVLDQAEDVAEDVLDQVEDLTEGAGKFVERHWLDSIIGALESIHVRTDAYNTHVHVSPWATKWDT